MTIEFGERSTKQRLADLLGGTLIEYDQVDQVAVTRGHDQVRLEAFGRIDGERRLGFWVRCGLDRAAEQGDGAGDRQDPRPRVDGLPALLLRPETAKDRRGRRFGLNREVQTGYPDFDEKVYIESAAPDEPLRVVLGSRETKDLVRTLLLHHCESVAINKVAGGLEVAFLTYERTADSLPQLAEELNWVIAQTLALKASLPVFVGNTRSARKYRRIEWGYYTELILFALGILGIIFGEKPLNDRPWLTLLGGAGAAIVLSVPLAWLVARGHPRGVKHFLGFVIVGFFTLPVGVVGVGLASNSLFDPTSPQVQSLVTLANPEYCSHDKHWVAVRDWRDPRKSFNLALHNTRLCGATKRGDILDVTVRQGRWGWTYISDVAWPRRP